MREVLGPFDLEWTRGPRDAERIAREAARDGAARIVVAGGDGTVSEVASGLLQAGLGDAVDLALLPLGTGADLPRGVGVPQGLGPALQAIARGRRRRIDAGRIHYLAADGRPCTACFVNVASFGLGGLVAERVNRGSKRLGGRLAFLLGTLRALMRFTPEPVRISLDGEAIFQGPLTLGAAANGTTFGGGMLVAPGAQPDDGLLDVVIVRGTDRTTLLRRLPRVYRGTHLALPEVRAYRGRCLEATSSGAQVWIEVDGESLGTLPVRVEVLPGALRLVGVVG